MAPDFAKAPNGTSGKPCIFLLMAAFGGTALRKMATYETLMTTGHANKPSSPSQLTLAVFEPDSTRERCRVFAEVPANSALQNEARAAPCPMLAP